MIAKEYLKSLTDPDQEETGDITSETPVEDCGVGLFQFSLTTVLKYSMSCFRVLLMPFMKQNLFSDSFQEKNERFQCKQRRWNPPKEKDGEPSSHARTQPTQIKPVILRRFGRAESKEILPAPGDSSEIWYECIKLKVFENEHAWGQSEEIESSAKHPEESDDSTGRRDAHCEGSEKKSKKPAYDSTSIQFHQERKWNSN